MVEQAVVVLDRGLEPRRVLLGLTFLERVVLTLGHGGIRRLLILGSEAGVARPERLRAGKELKRSGLEVSWAAAGAMEAALPLPREPFLLVRASVVFASGLAGWLHELQPEGPLLLVRAGDEGRCFRGLAVCAAAFFPRLIEGLTAPSERDGLAAPFPAQAGAVMAVPPEHGWVVADSPASVAQARALLRRSLGKPSDGFFSRHLNRRISWPLSRLLIRLRVRPNLVTTVNLALGLLSGWLIGRGGYGNTLAAGLLFQFVSIFDGCDGEIARLTFRFSDFGTRLDNLCDWITLVFFFLNLPIGLHAATRNPFWLASGALMVLLVVLFYLLLLVRIRLSRIDGNIAELARQVQEKNKGGKPISWLEWLGVRLGFVYRKEFISLYAAFWCVLGLAEVFLWNMVVLTSVGLVYQLDSIRKLLAQRRAKR